MSEDPKEDARIFGENVWVYCDQHMRPHLTGWCTVGPRNKTKLDATDMKAAFQECRDKGYELYEDLQRKNQKW